MDFSSIHDEQDDEDQNREDSERIPLTPLEPSKSSLHNDFSKSSVPSRSREASRPSNYPSMFRTPDYMSMFRSSGPASSRFQHPYSRDSLSVTDRACTPLNSLSTGRDHRRANVGNDNDIDQAVTPVVERYSSDTPPPYSGNQNQSYSAKKEKQRKTQKMAISATDKALGRSDTKNGAGERNKGKKLERGSALMQDLSAIKALSAPCSPSSLAITHLDLSTTSNLEGQSTLTLYCDNENDGSTIFHGQSVVESGDGDVEQANVHSRYSTARRRLSQSPASSSTSTSTYSSKASSTVFRRYGGGPPHPRVRQQQQWNLGGWGGAIRQHVSSLQRRRRTSLSPRSKNLADLEYLTQQHRAKVEQMGIAIHSKTSESGQEQDEYPQEHFDFCLVLQPQEVYSFWSTLLDFREEILGPEIVEEMETMLVEEKLDRVQSMSTEDESWSPSSGTNSNNSDGSAEEELDKFDVSATPSTRTQSSYDIKSMGAYFSGQHTPTTLSRSKMSLVSPCESMLSKMTCRQSVFERAIGKQSVATTPPPGDPNFNQLLPNSYLPGDLSTANTPATMTSNRRRWGNQNAGVSFSTPNNMLSPPIRSLTRGFSTLRRPAVALTDRPSGVSAASDSPPNHNKIRMEEIPTQVIPRGIAARTNGLLQFLSALKRGIVLRKHKPGQRATFCRIISHDGGDTIHYQFSETIEAMNAFKEQRVRYNPRADENTVLADAQPWSLGGDISDQQDCDIDDMSINSMAHNFSVPDHVAAKQYRKQMIKEQGLGRTVNHIASKVVRSGTIRAADIIVVHPATHDDPRSENSKLGTKSFRRSKSEYFAQQSFSLVTRLGGRFARGNTNSIDDCESKWYNCEGTDALFQYFDFEMATMGEYWLVLRGFILLQRDAAVGRFAEHRKAGIGSHYSRLELEQLEQQDFNRLHRDEFHEPVTVGWLEKLFVEFRDLDKTYMEGFTLPGAVPPPSDYFLGFRSPGTAIWSRLRQAGMETQRLYSLDPRCVMIKVRCPSHRLMDVCEVLRLKLQTRDGSFAPFRESMIDIFRPLDDLSETPLFYRNSVFQFRSSIRQTIIDFIIGSRIRDSGAELGKTTDLGRMIQASVPLHMHSKLNAIYDSWVYFWRIENWENGRNCKSMTHRRRILSETEGKDDFIFSSEKGTASNRRGNAVSKEHNIPIPGLVKRFLTGCFHQPLDSIEQYFGEKVAFYFAWLQHTADHMVFLSIAGLFLFICQVQTGNFDHFLCPYFAMIVMLWTFYVLIDWRKRANCLAFRWGTMNYKEQETTRPQFHGDYTRDDVTGEWVLTYPRWKRWLKYAISIPLTLLFTMCTLWVILLVHYNRDRHLVRYVELKTNPNSTGFKFEFETGFDFSNHEIVEMELTKSQLLDINFWLITAGMPTVLGLFLPLLNLVLMRLSIMLNNFENYRTESEYRNHLVIKVFSFRFICYFATLYYYAFVSVGSDEQIAVGILRVGIGILIYTTVAHWWQVFLQVYFPLLIRALRMRHRRHRLRDTFRDIELEEEEVTRILANSSDQEKKGLRKRQIELINKRLLLEQAQDDTWLEVMRPEHDSFPEYIQAVVLFTYVSCFSVVLPITPLICLFNYLMSMRLDAYKLCKGRRRPLAEKTGGIGVWEHLLHIVSVISILTNCWLMGFTNSHLRGLLYRIRENEEMGYVGVFAIVVVWEHVMLLIKYVMSISISPFPKSVLDAMKREQHELEQQRSSSMWARRRPKDHKEEKEATENDFSGADENRHPNQRIENDGVIGGQEKNGRKPSTVEDSGSPLNTVELNARERTIPRIRRPMQRVSESLDVDSPHSMYSA